MDNHHHQNAEAVAPTGAAVFTRVVRLFTPERPFRFESGVSFAPIDVAYETYGSLNRDGSNCVLICHALTGDAHVGGFGPPLAAPGARPHESTGTDEHAPLRAGWWEPMIGPGRAFDTEKYFVVCANFLGSCYGTTGPASPHPSTGKPYRLDFPQMTVRDMVRLQRALLDMLGVHSITCITGGSLGGMQTLEWAIMYPDFVRSIIPTATSAAHSAWAIGLNEVERAAIMNDPAWMNGRYDAQPVAGLALAREIAMMTYRSKISFDARFGRDVVDGPAPLALFQVESYLRYQGKKLVGRFDAATYVYITRAMDMHNVAAGRGSLREALGSITAKTLCLGIDSDILYPAAEQREIQQMIPGAAYAELSSAAGHDAFLIEFDRQTKIVRDFLSRVD